MPHVVGFAKKTPVWGIEPPWQELCANMCRHVLRASVEPHQITPGEREGGAQEKNTHTNVRRFSLQKQQKIEGWNQQQRRKQESQNQHVWKIGTPTSKSFQAQSNVVVNTIVDEGGTRSPVLLLYPRTNLTYELLQLNYSRNRETSLKNALPDPKSQQHKQLIDCRKWETDTGNGVHKKQQMKPSSSRHIKKDIHTWLMFTTSLGFKSW